MTQTPPYQLFDFEPFFKYMNKNFDMHIRNSKDLPLEQQIQKFHIYSKGNKDKYNEFIKQVTNEVLADQSLPPLLLIKKMEQLCMYRRDEYKSICQLYYDLKIKEDNLVGLIDNLDVVETIPDGGLSNVNIQNILQIYEKFIPSFKFIGILTADFMVCDIQRRFKGENINISPQYRYQQMNKLIQTQDIYKINTQTGNWFVRLTLQDLQDFLQRGVHQLASIINTDTCLNGGVHWVALYIDLKKKQILFFNSVGQIEYKKELEGVKIYCNHLKQLMDQLDSRKTELVLLEDQVQEINNICGVYTLLFITCQLFGVHHGKVQQVLKYEKNRGEQFVLLFKRILFG